MKMYIGQEKTWSWLDKLLILYKASTVLYHLFLCEDIL